jgi:hypothetical protein
LHANLSRYHPFSTSPVYRSGILKWLKDKLAPENASGFCEGTNMIVTGIPPNIELGREVSGLREENTKLREMLERNHEEIITTLPTTAVTKEIMENIHIEGVQQMSKNELKGKMESLFSKFQEEATNSMRQQHPSQNNTSLAIDPTHPQISSGYNVWYWGGALRPVPESFKFPKCSVKDVCDISMFGYPDQKIKPFRMTKSKDFKREDQQYFAKASYCFNLICKTICDLKNIAFGPALEYSINLISSGTDKAISRGGDLKYTSLYEYSNKCFYA